LKVVDNTNGFIGLLAIKDGDKEIAIFMLDQVIYWRMLPSDEDEIAGYYKTRYGALIPVTRKTIDGKHGMAILKDMSFIDIARYSQKIDDQ